MKILPFDKNMTDDKKEKISAVNNIIEKATNFIVIYSGDNIKTSEFIDFNVSNLEAISLCEILKHVYLHRVFPEEYDDDPESGEIPLCNGE